MTDLTQAIRVEANAWRLRIESGLSPKEKAEFDRWIGSNILHREALAEAEIFWEATNSLDFRNHLSVSFEEASNIENPAEPTEADETAFEPAASLPGTMAKLAGGALAMAASLAVFVAVGGLDTFRDDPVPLAQVFETQTGVTQAIRLPDNSRVTLGADSEMTLTLSDTARVAKLTRGSAFFDVSTDPDRPFTVSTSLGSARVVGTRFDVSSRANETVIAVLEGAVDVADQASDTKAVNPSKLVLTANQAVEITRENGLGLVYDVFPAEIGAWRSGRLVYVRKSLASVVEDLNRYSQSRIEVADSVADLQLSGTYETRNLDEILAALEDALPIRIVSDSSGRRIVAK